MPFTLVIFGKTTGWEAAKHEEDQMQNSVVQVANVKKFFERQGMNFHQPCQNQYLVFADSSRTN